MGRLPLVRQHDRKESDVYTLIEKRLFTDMLWCRILGEVVGNFPNFLEEVTLLADPECVRLKNYCKEDS